mgnify:CR=1 FL=1
MLEKLLHTEGIEIVLREMAQSWQKLQGGKFQLQYFADHLAEGTSIVEFEVRKEVKVGEKTAIGYLKELSEKYSPGSVIADVPSNRVGANAGIFEENGGKTLRGQMILEVPVQKEPVPEKVLDYANEHRIKIRDTNNKIYN